MAENVSESLTRGSRVMVAGRLEQRSWETQEGDQRSKVEVVADEIGPSLRWATAQITKNERRGPSDGRRGGGGGGGGGRQSGTGAAGQPAGRRRLRIRRGALLMARSNQRGGTAPAARPQGPRPPGQEEALRPLPRQDRVGRLQGRPDAAQVHERPRQDPLASGHRQLRAAPAGARPGHQDGTRTGPPPLHPAHGDRTPGRSWRT